MLIFGDLHTHISHPVMGGNFINLSVNALKQIREFAITNNEEYIVHLGDWTHLKDRIYTKVWNAISRELEVWEDYKFFSYWLMGNHDFDSDISIEVFNSFPHAVALTTSTIQCMIDKGTYLQCIFLPYGSKREDLEKLDIDYDKQIVVFLHDYIKGISKLSNNITALDGWNLKDLDKAHFIFAGHVHEFQEIMPGRVFHVGSPYQVSFNEVGQKKYFLQFDGKEVIKHEFSFPQFIELNLDEAIHSSEIVPNSYVKLKYTHDKYTNKEIQEYKEFLLSEGVIKVKAEAHQVKRERKERMEIKENTVNSDFLLNYVKISKTELDKSILYKLGEQIIGGK